MIMLKYFPVERTISQGRSASVPHHMKAAGSVSKIGEYGAVRITERGGATIYNTVLPSRTPFASADRLERVNTRK